MDRIAHALTQLNVSEADKKDILDGIAKLADKSHRYPSSLWECMGSGAFKECYLWTNVAVKFAAEDNYTMDTEAKAYNIMIDNGIEKLFAKTFFLPIPSEWDVRSDFLDGDNSFTYDPESHTYIRRDDGDPLFDCLVIQERVAKIYGDMCVPNDCIIGEGFLDTEEKRRNSYEKNPLFDEFGNEICYEQALHLYHSFDYRKWVQDAIIAYGLAFMMKAAKVCDDLYIHDLHRQNIGYRFDGTPVIFDFLS